MTISLDIKHSRKEDTHRGAEQAASTVIVEEQENVQNANKRRKLEKTLQHQKSEKATRTSKQSVGLNDVKSPSAKQSAAQAEDTGHSMGGLYDGFGDTWEPDPLTLFMFENAPVLIEICMRSQEAMTKAEIAQTKAQAKLAQMSAQDTVKRGQQECKNFSMQAGQAFAEALTAGLQLSLQKKNDSLDDEVMAKHLEAHDDVLSKLTTGKLENENTLTGVREANPEEGADALAAEGHEGVAHAQRAENERVETLSEQEQKQIEDKVRAFKQKQEQYSDEIYNDRQQSRETVARKSGLGLERSEEWVSEENRHIANRNAAKKAFHETFVGTKEQQKNETVEQRAEREAFDALLKQDDVKGVAARRHLMKSLFGENTQEIMPHHARMDYLRDWGGGNTLRDKALRDYGCTQEGVKMRDEMYNLREPLTYKVNREAAMNKKVADTRQLVLQNLSLGIVKGFLNMKTQDYAAQKAQYEAEAQWEQQIASVHSQAKNTEDSFIAGQSKDMEGIYEWFQNLHGQLLSAQASAASA